MRMTGKCALFIRTSVSGGIVSMSQMSRNLGPPRVDPVKRGLPTFSSFLSTVIWVKTCRLKKGIKQCLGGLKCSQNQDFPQVARDFPKRFPQFLKKSLKSCLKNNQKLLKGCSKKRKPFFGLMLKCANCTTKLRFLRIFVQFCGVTSLAK